MVANATSVAPDVRAEAVARGKALIADPNYPSPEQILKIASVLATRWTRQRVLLASDAIRITAPAGGLLTTVE